jgi:hypothetical protein
MNQLGDRAPNDIFDAVPRDDGNRGADRAYDAVAIDQCDERRGRISRSVQVSVSHAAERVRCALSEEGLGASGALNIASPGAHRQANI